MAMRKFSKFLDLSSGSDLSCGLSPPTDIKFLFNQQTGVVKELKAHKVILAFASEVFNREFYGSLDTEDEIDIVDAGYEVFQAMLEFIYHKQQNWTDYDLGFLSSLYYLADKYDLEELRNEIIVSIPEHEVSMENVLDIAMLAEDNRHHLPLSESLFDVTVSFLNEGFKGKFERAIDLVTEDNEKHAMVIFKLILRMKKNESPDCENCKVTPCLNGKGLEVGNFVPGAQVRDTLESHWSIVKLIRVEDDEYKDLFTGSLPDGSVISDLVDFYKYNCF